MATEPVVSYTEKFKHLPKQEREKLGRPEIMKAIADLENTYNADLISVVAKVIVSELAAADLAGYLAEKYQFDQAKAEQAAAAIKDKVLNQVLAS